MATYMYVSLQDDDKVLIFGVDSGTGALTPKGEVPAVGGPSASTISPDRKVFYVGHRNSKEISSFGIDPNTGGLTLIGRIPVPDSPTYLSPDRNGRFLRQWPLHRTEAERDLTPLPHCLRLADDGLVYVCDRQADRIQVFDRMGTFIRNIIQGGAEPAPLTLRAEVLEVVVKRIADAVRHALGDVFTQVGLPVDEGPAEERRRQQQWGCDPHAIAEETTVARRSHNAASRPAKEATSVTLRGRAIPGAPVPGGYASLLISPMLNLI